MKLLFAAVFVALLAVHPAGAFAAAPGPAAAGPSLPHRVVRLHNGMTLVLMPDNSLPNIGVELWLRGGAREERPGEHGVAHLFEHQLSGAGVPRLFGNPENRALAARASRGSGAGTDFDYVNIYRVVAPEGLEVQLATLAEQLDPRGERFTSRRLQTDKDIVISELRRNSSLEWNLEVLARRQRGPFGAEHPYGHAISGSESDVRAATVALMRDWLQRAGGAGGATLFIVGNFDPAAAEAMARRHFGPLPQGAPQARAKSRVPQAATRRETIEVAFSTGGVFLRWPTPGWGTEDGDRLALLSTVLDGRLKMLGAGKGRSSVEQWELAGAFELSDNAASAAAAGEAEARLASGLQALLRTGPSAPELERAKAQWKTEFLLNLQQPVWRGSRAEAVGRGLLFHENPDHFRVRMARIAAASPKELRDAGQRWLGKPSYVLHALPQGGSAPAPAAQRVEPGPTIAPSPSREPRFPVVETRAAGAGKLLVASQPNSPLTRVTIAFPAGYATDGADSTGRARAVLSALPQVKLASGKSVAETIAELGGRLETNIDPDFASLSFTVISEESERGMRAALGALSKGPSDVDFREALTKQQADAAAARKDPLQARLDVAACALFDPCGPGMLDGVGGEKTLTALSHDRLTTFYRGRYNATNALVIVSGAADGGRLTDLIEAGLPAGPAAPPAAPWAPRTAVVPRVRVIDTPGAAQAALLLVQPLPAGLAKNPTPSELATLVFRQRVMQVLRTEKGWSYEPYPYGNRVGRTGSYLYMNLPVQTDKAALAIKEVEAEAERLRKTAVDPGFATTSRGYLEGSIMRGLTSMDDMNAQLLERARGDLPADYYTRSLRSLPNVSPEEVRSLMERTLAPDRFIWIIAGDLKQVRPVLEAERIPYEVIQAVGP